MTIINIEECFKHLEREHQIMEQAAQPEKRLFSEDVFIKDTTLADILGPPQEYLFYENILGKQVGVMPKGEPCMIAAPGGTGKSFLALACAIAAASGENWLHYQSKKPVKTIFIGAEDNQNTLGNRFYRLLRGMGINNKAEAFANMKKNLALWGKKGHRLPLIGEDGQHTNVFADLKYRLEQEGDIGLVVLDPARSFMAKDTESDNGSASEWKDLICALSEIKSRPTILVTHHTNKSAIRGVGKDLIPSFDQSSVRGASALVDGFRWILNMQKIYQNGQRKIFLKIGKSNFSDDGNLTEWRLNYENGGIFEKIENNNPIVSSNISIKKDAPANETSHLYEKNYQRSLMDSIEI